MPSASLIEAIVLAVPITAQVPAVVARLPSTSWISAASISPARYFCPEAPAIGAGAQPLAAMPARGHHRPGDEPDRRPVGRDRAHQLRRHRLVAAADSTTASIGWARIISSVSIAIRLRNIRLVGDRNTSPSEMVGNTSGSRPPPARRASPPRSAREMPMAIVEAAERVSAMPITGFATACRANSPSSGERAPQIKREIGSP
jgi:hypothetical protein